MHNIAPSKFLFWVIQKLKTINECRLKKSLLLVSDIISSTAKKLLTRYWSRCSLYAEAWRASKTRVVKQQLFSFHQIEESTDLYCSHSTSDSVLLSSDDPEGGSPSLELKSQPPTETLLSFLLAWGTDNFTTSLLLTLAYRTSNMSPHSTTLRGRNELETFDYVSIHSW